MDELLSAVLDAHGGLENWQKASTDSPRIAHYTHDPKTFDGFAFPTRRLVHGRDADGIADQSFAAITIDIDTVAVERS